MESYIRRATSREPKPTDRKLDFATYHDIVMAVARSLGIGLDTEPAIPVLRFMELDDDLPPYDETAEADDETGNMPYIDKSATVLYYDLEDQFWKRDDTQQKVVVCNPYAGFYPKAGRFVFLYLAQAAKWIPFSPQRPRMFVKLTEDLDCRWGGHSALARIIEFTFTGDTTGTWVDTTREVRVWSGPKSQIGIALANMTVEVEWFDGPGWVAVRGGKARIIKCEATAAFNTTTPTVYARVVDYDDPDENPDPAGAGLALINDLGFAGLFSEIMYAEYMPSLDKYRIYEIYQR